LFLAGSLGFSTLACSGVIGSPGQSDDGDSTSGATTPPGGGGVAQPDGTIPPAADGWPPLASTRAFQLRRLTTEQYTASVKTLLAVSTDAMPPIEHLSPVGGFSAIGASTAAVSSAGVGQFEDAARYLAHQALATTAAKQKIVPCTPAGTSDTACFTSFVKAFGQRVFRRPLTAAEVMAYAGLTAEVGTSTGDVWQGVEATLSAFLQSPNFLYMVEVGAPDPMNPSRYQYTGYEMASRLSYFLTNDTPDDALLAAAASGSLATREGVQAEAARLLALPDAHDAMRTFFSTLLSLDSLDTLSRPVEIFPKFTPTLGPAMKEETLLGFEDLVFTRDGDYRGLFDQPQTFVNGELASLYGVAAPSGNGFAQVTLPASSKRAGLLGQAGVLAARDHSDGTSPTKRGLFILTRLLCQDLPLAPPANLQIPPPPTGLITARQKLEEHAANAVCASCHQKTDPVGLSLEHLDAMGVYREQDHGLVIDDTGQIGSTKYNGEVGLAAVLRDHPALSPCLIQSFYGVSVGHLPTAFDGDTFSAVVKQFADSGARIRSLLTAITASDGFRYMPAPNGT
jgi:hypothetical protein